MPKIKTNKASKKRIFSSKNGNLYRFLVSLPLTKGFRIMVYKKLLPYYK